MHVKSVLPSLTPWLQPMASSWGPQRPGVDTHTLPPPALSAHACERFWPGAVIFAPASRITIDLSHQQTREPSVLRHAQTASRFLSFGTRTSDWSGIKTA
jgi:hypothetical protein